MSRNFKRLNTDPGLELSRQISSLCRLCDRSHPVEQRFAGSTRLHRARLWTRHQSGSLLQSWCKPNHYTHSSRCHIVLSSTTILVCIADAQTCRFTRQGLLQDLTQVDALHDLIEADTEVHRVWALGSAAVKFSKLNVMCRDRPAKTMTLRSEIITVQPTKLKLSWFCEKVRILKRTHIRTRYFNNQLIIESTQFLPARSQAIALLPSRIMVRSSILKLLFSDSNVGKSSLSSLPSLGNYYFLYSTNHLSLCIANCSVNCNSQEQHGTSSN